MADEDGFDDLLKMIKFGKWNLHYYISYGFCTLMLPCFQLSGAFVAPNIKFECDTSQVGGVFRSQSKCEYTLIENSTTEEEILTTESCANYTYTDQQFTNTMTSEFDLVCGDSYLRPSYQTFVTFGGFIGSPVIGFLSDRYGRKSLLVICSIAVMASTLLSTFTTIFAFVLFLRFLTGLAVLPVIQTGYTLCLEVTGPQHRSSVGILSAVPWALGTAWFGVLGYIIRDWRWLIRATLLPSVIYLTGLWFFDESPRWLIVTGRHKRALRAIKKGARWNGTELPSDEELVKKIVRIHQASSKTESTPEKTVDSTSFKAPLSRGINQILVLYKTPELRKRTLLMYSVFLMSAAVFTGLSLNAVNFQFDPFIYMIVGGLVELPAYSITVPMVMKLGRVGPQAFSFFLCGVTIIVLAFIPPERKWLVITLALVGRFFISFAYQIVFLISTEVYPTEVRMQGLGTSNFVATLGGIAAPFITELIGNEFPWVPSLIFGILSLFGAVASAFIPETQNKPLPETVFQLERASASRRNEVTQEDVGKI